MSATVDLEKLSARIRYRVVQISHLKEVAHLGSSLSCVDILVAAYWGGLRITSDTINSPDRDRLILSKGHGAAALYATLAERGIIPFDALDTIGEPGSPLEEHPSLGCAPGIEASTGSLGHGLPIGVGMALALKLRASPARVMIVMSDGECEEGSVWEAALLSATQKLDNLVAVVDFNKWQATARSTETMALNPLRQKWESFGWNAYEVDGHDLAALQRTMKAAASHKGSPSIIVAHTVKGKGVSFMEDDNNWHYRIPNAEEVEKARVELLSC